MRKPTDPRDLPDADPHTGNRFIDPVTGYDTTGHDWAGITELNTPFPKIVIWALILTFIYSAITWVLLPAWPYGRDYTRGLLGLDQSEMAQARLKVISLARDDWMVQFTDPDFAALADDPATVARATAAAHRLFKDNCAACHGETGAGGPGFPVLNDGYWLWAGDPVTIAETLTVGINSEHPDTRIAEMPMFDWLERDERSALAQYVAALPLGSADHASPAGVLFEDNCASCHGDQGVGGLEVGAPSLVDAAVIYGQDKASVEHTLRYGRRGVMPFWSDRLSVEEINMLAFYVSRLADTKQEAAQ